MKKPPQIRCLARLLADRRGASVMETALIVPLLATMVAGASDVALGFSEKLKVQQAAARSIELATAGGLSSTAFTTLQYEAATAAGVPTSQVVVDYWLECDSVRQSNFNGTCSTGQTARFVSITVNGSYTPIFSFLLRAPITDSNGQISLTGYASVRVQ
ncbi:MAG TPA: TadE/TadG family type IV pilus assembly protein [Sphingobium sp.]|nr:TadE/TadG family type IV pilus assembly protein [Sphingobium sp.]